MWISCHPDILHNHAWSRKGINPSWIWLWSSQWALCYQVPAQFTWTHITYQSLRIGHGETVVVASLYPLPVNYLTSSNILRQCRKQKKNQPSWSQLSDCYWTICYQASSQFSSSPHQLQTFKILAISGGHEAEHLLWRAFKTLLLSHKASNAESHNGMLPPNMVLMENPGWGNEEEISTLLSNGCFIWFIYHHSHCFCDLHMVNMMIAFIWCG